MRRIGRWLSQRERLSKDREAVVDQEVRLSYGELNQRVNRLANALKARGLAYGDRLAMLSYNRHQFVEVIFACAKLGLILVPLTWRLSPSELAFILGDSRAGCLIFDHRLAKLAADALAQSPVELLVALAPVAEPAAEDYAALLAEAESAEPAVDPQVNGDSPHILMYTAGTTGRPKGAILSQAASFWNSVNLNIDLDFTSRARNLVVLPMFHIGGIGLFTLPMLHIGATVVVQRSFDPAQTLALMENKKITHFFGVPAIFQFLAQQPEFPGPLTDLEFIMSGGAPLPVSLIKQYHEHGLILRQGFGMSEAAPSIATLPAEMALSKAGSVGRPCFHLEARIMDAQGRELPPDQVGELVIRGPNLCQGYWNRPQATEEAFSQGWFHTGDLARLDPEGCLFIVDRKKDMFISGGENVYPAEVEQVIYQLEQVAEAAVIGLPDPKWGEAGCAVVALKEGQGLSADEVVEFIKGRLAKFKVPKRIEFIGALPRNAAGKVLKTKLRQRFARPQPSQTASAGDPKESVKNQNHGGVQ